MASDNYDIAIVGGLVVDGTGAPGREQAVGIRDGVIAAIGDLEASARETIDASGCVVSPGFVDPHTHLDAQLMWDPSGSPSVLHGVTTVVLGHCGFGIAPCRADGGDYLLRSLENVEEIPFECSSAGVDFEWGTWSEYFDAIGRQGLGVNVAGFVPHSALRHFVMGDRASSDPASSSDVSAMVTELSAALRAGAVGFSTSRGVNHVDGNGNPVPSRVATDSELQHLVDACRGRLWQINVATKFASDPNELLDELSAYVEWTRAAGARLTWTPLHANVGFDAEAEILRRGGAAPDITPQVANQAITTSIRFDRPSALSRLAGWGSHFADYATLSSDDRSALLRSGELRHELRASDCNDTRGFPVAFDEWRIVHAPSAPTMQGQTVLAGAQAAGRDPIDFLLDLAVADRLETIVLVPAVNRDHDGRRRLVCSPDTLVGLGDTGAHINSITNFTYPTDLLCEYVRDDALLSLEAAIAKLTSRPAHLLGLDRGRLRVGGAADVCVFDLEGLGLARPERRTDLPAGGERLFQGAAGYRSVLVNGVEVVNDGQLRTDVDAPGALVRSGSV